MSFADTLKTDMRNVFLQEFAEDIVYVKRTGAQRPIKALVVRGDIKARPEAEGVSRSMRVHVVNDATYGVLDSELDDGDYLLLPWEPYGTPTVYYIVSVPLQDKGRLVFQFGGT